MFTILLAVAFAAEPKSTESPSDALSWVIGDMAGLLEAGQSIDDFYYIWIPPWAGEHWDRGINWVVNETAAQSANLVYPATLSNGWLLRYDKRLLAPDDSTVRGNGETDRQRIDRVLYEIARQDFRFYLPTGRNVRLGRKYEARDGRTYGAVKEVGYATWLDDNVLAAIGQFQLALPANLVTADIFVDKAYSSINDGRYYELIGVDFNPKKNSRDDFLDEFGIDLKKSEEKRASLRAGLYRSVVTQLERIVERSQGIVGESWRTLDRGRNDKRRVFQQFNNLFNDRHTAEEIFVTRRNGTIAKLISDGDGNIVGSVPDDVASDYHGARGDTRIFAGLSCLRCHCVGRSRHYNRVTQDLAKIFEGFPAIVDEQSDITQLSIEAVDRIASEFMRVFEFEYKMSLARIDFELTVRRATRIGGTSIPSHELSNVLSEIYNSVRHGTVDAKQVLLEFGWIAGDNPEQDFLEKFPLAIAQGQVLTFQDINHRALSKGIPIKYQDDFTGSYARLAISHKLWLQSIRNQK